MQREGEPRCLPEHTCLGRGSHEWLVQCSTPTSTTMHIETHTKTLPLYMQIHTQGHKRSLKGTVHPKIKKKTKKTIISLSASAIYPSRLFWWETSAAFLSNIIYTILINSTAKSLFRNRDPVTQDNLVVSIFMSELLALYRATGHPPTESQCRQKHSSTRGIKVS